ncbi:MAG: amino acid ABC transporter substrate-binding protein [Gloeomargaritaceae cyanobacterium C42_A2020_066]|nr:amino acid ABC transporter substrate-binding protein [Gloeomargaritaceae cyanobacterium C42_A2020_066]
MPLLTPGILTIGASDFDARPMSWVEGNERYGYEPAVARAVCERLHLQPHWLNLPMAAFYDSLLAGRCDVVWFNQAITPERQQRVIFTQPYGIFDEAVLVRRDSGIRSVADLAGRPVAALADSTNLELVRRWPGVTAVPFPGSDQVLPEMLAAVRRGEVDGVSDDELVLLAAAADDPALEIAFSVPSQIPFAIALRPADGELQTRINAVLTDLLTEGVLAQLWQAWIPWRPFPLA